jgi:hypothetical protein
MVAELDFLSEWIPEQMAPGTLFVLENAGQVGGHAQADGRIAPRHLRVFRLFRPVLHSGE